MVGLVAERQQTSLLLTMTNTDLQRQSTAVVDVGCHDDADVA
jgi:hypothetical protein